MSGMRDSLATLGYCTAQYLQETMDILVAGKWRPGDDVDRDDVVKVLACRMIGCLQTFEEQAEGDRV